MLTAGASSCVGPESRREEHVKICDDSRLSPGNSVQESGREGWSSQVDLQGADED